MPDTFRTSRRIEFRDTDAAGIAHFSSFFEYMEQSEHELLRSVGLSVLMRDSQGVLSWPRVSVHCDYRGAARFEDVLEIELRIERLGDKSITYAFLFLHDQRVIAEGKTTAVCCRLSADAPPQSMSIPEEIRQKLARFAP